MLPTLNLTLSPTNIPSVVTPEINVEVVDNVPKILKEGASKEEAEAMQKEIQEAGGKVSIK